MTSVLHQSMHVVEHAVRRQRNVAPQRHHYLHLHPSLGSPTQGFLQSGAQREIGVDELYAVLGGINGVHIEVAYDAWGGPWLAVHYPHHLFVCRLGGVGLQSRHLHLLICPEVFLPPYILLSHLVPYSQEYHLQLAHRPSLYSAVHVAPFAHLLRTFYIIVGHIHSAGVCHIEIG